MDERSVTGARPDSAQHARPAERPRFDALDAGRGVVAAAALLSADVHLVLYVEGYSGIAVIGPLFLVNVLAGLAIGLGMLVWRHWLPVLAAVGFGAATFAAYLTSRTVGLLGVHEQTWDAQGVLAAVAEIVAVVGGVAVLAAGRLRSRTGQ